MHKEACIWRIMSKRYRRRDEEQTQGEETKKRSYVAKLKEQAMNKEIKLTKQGNWHSNSAVSHLIFLFPVLDMFSSNLRMDWRLLHTNMPLYYVTAIWNAKPDLFQHLWTLTTVIKTLYGFEKLGDKTRKQVTAATCWSTRIWKDTHSNASSSQIDRLLPPTVPAVAPGKCST